MTIDLFIFFTSLLFLCEIVSKKSVLNSNLTLIKKLLECHTVSDVNKFLNFTSKVCTLSRVPPPSPQNFVSQRYSIEIINNDMNFNW